ncbi:DNA replication complex GINS protein SLD5-like [Montipora capricornis]|uniref:DNA replication complex GINS protein SLD5-like n=1 Tax=Montipora foliosa TaxID=591990 RepID=UPI0035F1E218
MAHGNVDEYVFSEGTTAGGDSDEEIEVTAAEVLAQLEEAWINEKFAPELLESKADLVECMLDQIKEMEGNLKKVKQGDVVASLHKLEIDRIRYILSSYTRTRIEKIEKHVVHVLEQEAARDENESSRLSPEELQYAKDYADNMEGLMKSLALQHMPANMQNIDRKKAVPRPNMDKYVFLKVLENQEQVMIDPEEDPIDMENGAQHIMRYSAIAPLLTNGSVALL